MMRRVKRKSLWIVAFIIAGMLALGAVGPGAAADYPSKPIRMIYPFPAGSGGDVAARILADAVSKEIGVPVKVSNVTGGSGTIGAAEVAKAKMDGYELGALPIGPSLTQPIFSGKLPYGTEDLQPICLYTYLPIVIIASTKTPYKTTKEFTEYAKAHPGEVKFAHPGLGTVPYMMLKALQDASGIKMKGIPFKGLRPGVTACVGGHVDIALAVAAPALGLKKGGKVKILGIFSGERMKLIPDVPTVEEDGVKTYPQVWSGIFAPKGIDPAVLKKLEDAFGKVCTSQGFKDAMLKTKMPILYMDSKAFQSRIDSDIEYFKAYKAKSGK